MIEYHNPDASVGVDETPYELSVTVSGTDRVRLGLLANGFPDSVNFLQELGTALKNVHPGIELLHYNKGNASIPAGEELLRKISGECVGAIAAYGH